MFPEKKSLFLIALILTIHTWFITDGKWDLFGMADEGYGGVLNLVNGVPYDSLGQNLLKGKTNVEPSTILWEAIERNGMTYMYFGPFPALIRIIPNLLFPDMYGKWSRLSCLVASLLTIIAFSFIISNQLSRNFYFSHREQKLLFCASILGFGFGSPILILMTKSHIYHESIIWGLCWSIWSVYITTLILNKDSKTHLSIFALSFCSGAALLSRVTFGVPQYLTLVLILVNQIIQFVGKLKKEFNINNGSIQEITRFLLKVVILASPAILALGFQLWYNFERYGSVVKFLPTEGYAHASRTWFPSKTFNLDRIPTTVLNYLAIRPEYFSKEPPFVSIPYIKVLKEGIFYLDHDSRSLSLIVASPWLIFGALVGMYLLLLKRNMTLFKFCALSYLTNIFMILTTLSVSQRYTNEFLPFLVFIYSYFLSDLGNSRIFNLGLKKIILLILTMCIFSTITTVLSSMEWAESHTSDGGFRTKIRHIFGLIDSII